MLSDLVSSLADKLSGELAVLDELLEGVSHSFHDRVESVVNLSSHGVAQGSELLGVVSFYFFKHPLQICLNFVRVVELNELEDLGFQLCIASFLSEVVVLKEALMCS